MNAETSNRLPFLAAEIRREHKSVATALKDSLRHALAAGDALLDAKAALEHGQWLPWLKDHCAISERTAQLYMRVAKHRAEIESQTRNDVADLTLSEAAAVLALSSDVRKLLSFIKSIEGLDAEGTLEAAMDAGIPVIHDPSYNPLAGRSEDEKRDWYIFMLFLVREHGWHPESAGAHTEWILQKFHNVAEWLGEEGDRYRRGWAMKPMLPAAREEWSAFHRQYAESAIADLNTEIGEIARRLGPEDLPLPRKRRRRAA